MIKEFFERRRTRKLFKDLVSPAVLDYMLSNPSRDDVRKLMKGTLEVILISIRGESPEVISARMGEVSDLSVEHNAVVESLISSLVVVVYGMVHFKDASTGDRSTLLSALRQKFGSDIKIVCLTSKGDFGNIGGKSRMAFSFIIPCFLDAIKFLAETPFGETREFQDMSTQPSGASNDHPRSAADRS